MAGSRIVKIVLHLLLNDEIFIVVKRNTLSFLLKLKLYVETLQLLIANKIMSVNLMLHSIKIILIIVVTWETRKTER